MLSRFDFVVNMRGSNCRTNCSNIYIWTDERISPVEVGSFQKTSLTSYRKASHINYCCKFEIMKVYQCQHPCMHTLLQYCKFKLSYFSLLGISMNRDIIRSPSLPGYILFYSITHFLGPSHLQHGCISRALMTLLSSSKQSSFAPDTALLGPGSSLRL